MGGRELPPQRPNVPATQAVPLPQRALGLLLVTHPIPSSLYVVAVALFSLLAARASHRPLDPLLLARVLAGVACTQIAIGTLNDYRDRALDALSKPAKPLVRGLITPRMALIQVGVATLLALVLFAPLGPLPLLLGALIEGLGVAYDLWFKGTIVSGLLYAVYFPLIPLLAWAVFGRYQPFLPWILPFGAALGVAMNVANSLPDLEDDLAAGVQGLPHLLGLRRGIALAWITPPVVAGALMALSALNIVPARSPGLALAVAAALLSALLPLALYARHPSPETLRTTFYVQALGVVVLATAWFAAVAL
jgi:geranylgeranylglycerol-phosphate geranylgeranyltransferase